MNMSKLKNCLEKILIPMLALRVHCTLLGVPRGEETMTAAISKQRNPQPTTTGKWKLNLFSQNVSTLTWFSQFILTEVDFVVIHLIWSFIFFCEINLDTIAWKYHWWFYLIRWC